ncbi:hypothetical protein QOT17_024822 [Balamuthia mandrillaris]
MKSQVCLLWALFSLASECTAQIPAGVSDPQNANATCVHISAFSAEELNGCTEFLDYEWIYADVYTASRVAFSGALFFSSRDPQCSFNYLRYACPNYFRRCDGVVVPEEHRVNEFVPATVPVGVFLCHSVCEVFRSSCLASLADTGLDAEEVTACEAPFYPQGHGFPKYNIMPEGPNYTIPITADGGQTFFNATLTCSQGNKNGSMNYRCPEGFHQAEGNFCTYDCPQPLVTDQQYDSLTTMTTVTGWISFVCLLVLIGSYVVTPAKWSYPAFLPLFFFSALLGRCFAFCLGSMVGHYDVWCGDDGEPNQWGDPWCTIQGMLFVYFTLAGAGWWAVISAQLFFSVVINIDAFGRNIKYPLMSLLHGSCWGLPLIPLVIALATEHLGYGHELWCTIHSSEELNFEPTPQGPEHQRDEQAEANLWNLALFTIPILVLVCICTVLLTFVIVVGYKKSNQGLKFFISQWRLMAFLLLYIIIYSFVLSFQINFHAAKEEQYSEYSSFLKCTFNQAAGEAVGAPPAEICELKSQVSYPLWMVSTFCEVGQGFFVFLIFGTSAEVYRALWYLLKHQRFASSASRPSITNSSDQQASNSLKKVPGHNVQTPHSIVGSPTTTSSAEEGDEEQSQ